MTLAAKVISAIWHSLKKINYTYKKTLMFIVFILIITINSRAMKLLSYKTVHIPKSPEGCTIVAFEPNKKNPTVFALNLWGEYGDKKVALLKEGTIRTVYTNRRYIGKAHLLTNGTLILQNLSEIKIIDKTGKEKKIITTDLCEWDISSDEKFVIYMQDKSKLNRYNLQNEDIESLCTITRLKNNNVMPLSKTFFYDNRIFIISWYDKPAKTLMHEYDFNGNCMSSIEKNGTFIVIASTLNGRYKAMVNETTNVLEIYDGKKLHQCFSDQRCYQLDFNNDHNSFLVAANTQGIVNVWNIHDDEHQKPYTIKNPYKNNSAVAWAGTDLLVASGDKILIYDFAQIFANAKSWLARRKVMYKHLNLYKHYQDVKIIVHSKQLPIISCKTINAMPVHLGAKNKNIIELIDINFLKMDFYS